MEHRYVFEDLLLAQKHSYSNRVEILESFVCGCFHCGKTFTHTEITTYLYGDTAVCPECNMDSVIGDASGFPIEHGLLYNMRRYWFDGKPFLADLGGEQHLILPGAAADYIKRARYSSNW